MKIKINYFFFIIAVVLPLVITPISIVIFWPLVFNPYQLLGPFWGIIGAYIVSFILACVAVAYPGIPWLAVIREDMITFHRFFRRKLVIMYKDVKLLEILSKKLPVETNKHSIGNLVFTMVGGNKYVVVAVPHYVSIELKKKLGDVVNEYYRKLTDEEFDKYAVGKKK